MDPEGSVTDSVKKVELEPELFEYGKLRKVKE
jgi:hypothetical protein